MKISVGGNMFLLGLALLIIVSVFLFAGEPDLHDVLLNRFSNGQIPLPTPTGSTNTWQ